jgi:PAS domain-containing protein
MPYDPAIYLRQLFESLDTGILIADDQGFYIDANRAVCEMLGRPRSAIVGHHLSEFIGARADDVDVQWRAFLRDGLQDGVITMLLPDNSSRPFHFHAEANFVPGLHCSFVSLVPDSKNLEQEQDVLKVCAWTKRVWHKERWISIEEYLLQAHDLIVTHGICPDALSALRR